MAVHESTAGGTPRALLKPRTLAALRVRWQTGQPGDYDAVVALFHRLEAARLDPRQDPGPSRIVNDSSGRPVTWRVLRQPYGPAADGYALAAKRLLDEIYPLALPERSLSGAWQVRVGLVPRGRALDTAAAAWSATVPRASWRPSNGEAKRWIPTALALMLTEPCREPVERGLVR